MADGVAPPGEINPEALAAKDEGNRFFATGKYEEAIERYLAALELQPGWAVAYGNLAACYLKLEDGASALKAAAQSINSEFTFDKGHARFANACLQVGRPHDALLASIHAFHLAPPVRKEQCKRLISKALLAARESDSKIGYGVEDLEGEGEGEEGVGGEECGEVWPEKYMAENKVGCSGASLKSDARWLGLFKCINGVRPRLCLLVHCWNVTAPETKYRALCRFLEIRREEEKKDKEGEGEGEGEGEEEDEDMGGLPLELEHLVPSEMEGLPLENYADLLSEKEDEKEALEKAQRGLPTPGGSTIGSIPLPPIAFFASKSAEEQIALLEKAYTSADKLEKGYILQDLQIFYGRKEKKGDEAGEG